MPFNLLDSKDLGKLQKQYIKSVKKVEQKVYLELDSDQEEARKVIVDVLEWKENFTQKDYTLRLLQSIKDKLLGYFKKIESLQKQQRHADSLVYLKELAEYISYYDGVTFSDKEKELFASLIEDYEAIKSETIKKLNKISAMDLSASSFYRIFLEFNPHHYFFKLLSDEAPITHVFFPTVSKLNLGFIHYLAHSKKLKKLNLAKEESSTFKDRGLTDEDCDMLANALAVNQSIEELNLANNGLITNKGAKSILNAIDKNKNSKLKRIIFAGTQVATDVQKFSENIEREKFSEIFSNLSSADIKQDTVAKSNLLACSMLNFNPSSDQKNYEIEERDDEIEATGKLLKVKR